MFLKVSESYYNDLRQVVNICMFSNKVYTGRLGDKFIKYDICGIALDDNEYNLIELKEQNELKK